MKKIIFLFLIVSLSSCGLLNNSTTEDGGTEVGVVEQQEENTTLTGEVDSKEPVIDPDTGIVKAEINTESLLEIENIDQVQELENQFDDYFQAKSGVIINKGIVDLVAGNCEFFEGKKTYYVEESGNKVERGVYNFKDHAYAAVDEGWCPGTETKEEKKTMIDTIISGGTPDKMKQFDTITSLQDIDPEELKLDTSSDDYKAEILAYTGLYMLTIDSEDNEKFEKYTDMYNDYLKYLSEDIYGKASGDFYHPILFATAAREGGCTGYINDYIVNY